MKKLALLLAFAPLYAKTPTHNLIVLLDFGQSEEKQRLGTIPAHTEAGILPPSSSLGAITSTALPALYQQVAPILISKSILKSIISRKMIVKDFLEKDITQLRSKYQRHPITQAPSLSLFKQHCRYAITMYNKIKDDLAKIFKTGSEEELRKAIDVLTSKQAYLEAAAPRSLHVHSSRQALSQRLHRELQVYLLCYLAPLEQYVIKDASQELALLVPHIKNAQHIPHTGITAYERQWGLKLHHLKDLSLPDLLTPTPMTYELSLSKIIANVLVTKKEGSQATWAVYIAGHGLPVYPERQQADHLEKLEAFYTKQLKTNKSFRAQQVLKTRLRRIQDKLKETRYRANYLPKTHERVICSSPCGEFQKTLEFLNTQVDTSLLYYTCCFGGGDHLEVPYRNRVLNYDIIVGSVSDAESFQDPIMLLIPPYACTNKGNALVVEGISRDSLDTKHKCLTMRTSLRFDKYFTEARKANRNPAILSQSLHPYATVENGLPQNYHENIAHIRSAHTKRFTVIPTTNIHTIPKNDSTIPESSEVVFLKEQTHGQVTLPKTIPSIISLIPGTACHIISSLIAPQTTLKELAKACLTLPSLSSSKIFYIKKIECKNDSLLPFTSAKTILHDVIVARNVPTTDGLKHHAMTSIYYTDNQGTCWHIPVRETLGSTYRTSGPLAHGELITLFPRLKGMLTRYVTQAAVS